MSQPALIFRGFCFFRFRSGIFRDVPARFRVFSGHFRGFPGISGFVPGCFRVRFVGVATVYPFSPEICGFFFFKPQMTLDGRGPLAWIERGSGTRVGAADDPGIGTSPAQQSKISKSAVRGMGVLPQLKISELGRLAAIVSGERSIFAKGRETFRKERSSLR